MIKILEEKSMETKEMFMLVFLIIGAVFALYGVFLGPAGNIPFAFGAAIIIAVGAAFGINIQNKVNALQKEVKE